MWNYEKRLQYPVKITQTNPRIAQVIITQFGGPDGMSTLFVPKKIQKHFIFRHIPCGHFTHFPDIMKND